MAKKKDDGRLTIDDDAVYRFCGEGLGIPGLPHEVTKAQAEKSGLLEVLQRAVELGVYMLVAPAAGTPPGAKVQEAKAPIHKEIASLTYRSGQAGGKTPPSQ
jgi:hypothetical protein